MPVGRHMERTLRTPDPNVMTMPRFESSSGLQVPVFAPQWRMLSNADLTSHTVPSSGQIAAIVAELYRPLARLVLVQLGRARRLPA